MRSEELDYQRALQAYLWAVPMVNAIEFWRALVDAGVSPTEPSLLVFDRPAAADPAVVAPDTQMIYAFTILDLAETGPVVAEIPAGFVGNFWDFHHRGLEVIGAGASADGGKFLLLPPATPGAVPAATSSFAAAPTKSSGAGAASSGRPTASTTSSILWPASSSIRWRGRRIRRRRASS